SCALPIFRRSRLTATGTVLGTVAFMPPEQIMGFEIDQRVDVFAVGATMFHVLTRRYLHEVDSQAELVFAMATMPAPSISSVDIELRSEVAQVIDCALRFDREDRYGSAKMMRDDIACLLAGEPPVGVELAAEQAAQRRREQAAQDPAEKREHRYRGRGSQSLPTVRDQSGDLTVDHRLPGALEEGDPGGDRARTGDSLVGKTLGARYRLEGVLGVGGMGAVYAATTTDGADVAVKVIRHGSEGGGRSLAKRFAREARAAGAIVHRNVVRQLDAGTDEDSGLAYIVMERLRGQDLQQAIESRAPLCEDAVVRMFLQVCRGLAAAHEQQVVHRDIKPANIFLHREAAGQVMVKLCDFGLAKMRGGDNVIGSVSALTRVGGMLGTAVYASPEQVKNARDADERADIWSVCMSMYEALTGQRPWQECATHNEIIVALCTEEPARVLDGAPWVDPQLAEIVEKGLRRDPAERWASAEALGGALGSLVAGAEELRAEAVAPVSGASRKLGQAKTRGARAASAQSKSGSLTALVDSGQRTGIRHWPRVAVAAAAVLAAAVLAAAFIGLRSPPESAARGPAVGAVESAGEVVVASKGGTDLSATVSAPVSAAPLAASASASASPARRLAVPSLSARSTAARPTLARPTPSPSSAGSARKPVVASPQKSATAASPTAPAASAPPASSGMSATDDWNLR
ncbi:MAG: serine/threonine-protein kinase, partial [Polyangiaceae bacterium]